MPNVQKLKAKERLEEIDNEVKALIEGQETRLAKVGALPEGEDSAKERSTLMAEVSDATLSLKKLRQDRLNLQDLVEAEELVEAEQRAGFKKRSPENPKKSDSEKALEEFSWHRFVDCALSEKFTGAEGEAVQEGLREAREIGRPVEGHPLPMDFVRVMGVGEDGEKRNMNVKTRVQSVGTNSEGGFMVESTLGNMIPALTPRTRVLGMGVQFFPGLQGNLEWPRETNVITGSSVAEEAAAAESSIVLEQVTMAPKRIAHFTEFTRKLMHQGKQAIDQLVPNRLNRGLGIEWDRQLINGSGASQQLLGLLNISGIGDVAGGTNGAAPTWALMLQLEELIADANADVGDIRCLTNPTFRRKLKELERTSGNGKYIWSDDNEVNSYPVEVSTQVPKNLTKGTGTDLSAFIMGYWPGMMVGHWGTDIIVNPFSKDKEAMVRVSAHLWTDMDVEHPEMFAAFQDAITT